VCVCCRLQSYFFFLAPGCVALQWLNYCREPKKDCGKEILDLSFSVVLCSFVMLLGFRNVDVSSGVLVFCNLQVSGEGHLLVQKFTDMAILKDLVEEQLHTFRQGSIA
jgi:hypothetical protein